MIKKISQLRTAMRHLTSYVPLTKRGFGAVVSDFMQSPSPKTDPGAMACIDAGLDWILEAQRQSSSQDGGVARNFDLRSGWAASYPETTGYIIPTLLQHAPRRKDGDKIRSAAEQMINWLVSIQLPTGAFHGSHRHTKTFQPVVFDTGQILFGLAAGVREFGRQYEAPLRKACQWLVDVQEADGAWRVPNPFAIPGDHVWETHVAWGMLEAAQVLGDEAIADAAMRNIRWAASRQHENGWYPDCALGSADAEAPLTHTIGYALRGILAGGFYARDQALLDAAIKTADALLLVQCSDGSLPGQLDMNWKAAVSWVCLTGCSQIAACWLLLHQETGREDYLQAALRANAYVRRTVSLTGPPEIRGGVKGSFPVWGRYCRYQYINWACKFLIDSCTLECAALENKSPPQDQ